MSYALDRSLALSPVARNLYSLQSDQSYWNFTSAFGGWIAAAMVAAVQSTEDYRGEVIDLTLNFIRSVKGERLYLRVCLTDRRRQMDFWQVALFDQPEGGDVLVSANVIAGERGAPDLDFTAPMPDVTPPGDSIRLEPTEVMPKWLAHFDQYFAAGVPFTKNPSPSSAVYIREADGRPLDIRSIAAIVDTPMPRTFFVSAEPRMCSTLSMNTQIHACDAEISAAGREYVLIVADSAAIRHGILNQEVRLFRHDGLLLATSYQTAAY